MSESDSDSNSDSSESVIIESHTITDFDDNSDKPSIFESPTLSSFRGNMRLGRRNSEINLMNDKSPRNKPALMRGNSDDNLLRKRRRSVSFGSVNNAEYNKNDSPNIINELDEEEIPTTPDDDSIALGKYTIGHLQKFPYSDEHEPSDVRLYDDEAILMYSLIKINKPKILMQIGLQPDGLSTQNILSSMEPNSKLYVFDPKPSAWKIVKPFVAGYKNSFSFGGCKPIINVNKADYDDKILDFVFFQSIENHVAAQKFFTKIADNLSDKSFIIITHPHIEDESDDLSSVDKFLTWIFTEYDDMWEVSNWGQKDRRYYLLKFCVPE